MTPKAIDEVVASLDLDLQTPGLCRACLLFVSSPVDEGDFAGARRWARRTAPWIWDEGFGEHALAAVRRAAERGVPGADEAAADLAERDGQSPVARAIVLRLAAAQAAEDRAWRAARLN